MARKRRDCADCGEPLSKSRNEWAAMWPDFVAYQYCETCVENYTTCSRCSGLHHLRDMSQAYCKSCRRAYDQDRWAKQRAARTAHKRPRGQEGAGDDRITAEQ